MENPRVRLPYQDVNIQKISYGRWRNYISLVNIVKFGVSNLHLV